MSRTERLGEWAHRLLIFVAFAVALIVVPNLARARDNGMRAQCMSNQKNYGTALEIYSTAVFRWKLGWCHHTCMDESLRPVVPLSMSSCAALGLLSLLWLTYRRSIRPRPAIVAVILMGIFIGPNYLPCGCVNIY